MQDLDTIAETVRIFRKHVTSGKHSQNQGLSGRARRFKVSIQAISQQSERCLGIDFATWDPEKSLGNYRFATLPFGSSRSVTAFNRIGSTLRKFESG